MTAPKNLSQIAHSYYVAEIENTPLLFHKVSGEVSGINKSAALLINLAQSGLSDQEIISELSAAMAISAGQIRQDIQALRSNLTETKTPEEQEVDIDDMPLDQFIAAPKKEAEKVCFYSIGGLGFEISYPDKETYRLCHSLLSALEVSDLDKPYTVLELVEGLNGWAIHINNQLEFAMEDQSSLADYIRTAILDTIGTKFANWVGLHAAGILNRHDEAVLFAAPSGSGKSTLAISLMLEGYDYLGDDTQILDLDKRQIWPFPTAANLKPGSWELFDSRLPQLANTRTFREEIRPVKFIPVRVDIERVNRAYKTKALVFPEYSEDATGEIKKIELAERIKLLSESGCYSNVEASAEMSQKYIEYILSLNAYHLSYNSSEQAIELLRKLDLLD